MKTGEPGLRARALFPSEAAFRAPATTPKAPCRYTPIPGTAIATVLLRSPRPTTSSEGVTPLGSRSTTLPGLRPLSPGLRERASGGRPALLLLRAKAFLLLGHLPEHPERLVTQEEMLKVVR